MVKVRENHPLTADGGVDVDAWLARIQSSIPLSNTEALRRACDMSYRAEVECDTSKNAWAAGASSFGTGLEMAEILAELHLDHDSLVAAILYRAVREGKLSAEEVQQEFGEHVAKLIEGVQRMAAIHIAQHHAHRSVLGQQDNQLHNVRKMLVAMIDDVQVVLIKLAERTCALRALKDATEMKRRRVAREIFDIYAPLAQRLGIGQLKWELEDLSFRYLHPKAYKKIASLLDGKRSERAQFIKQVVGLLTEKLQEAEINATVSGRAKHIYSIWRKMKRKNVSFNQIYDIRAVRVLAPTVKECYAALGVVHSLWQHIPREFDDYIAAPKENNYRSLHTAVLGPDSKIIEVQIRTSEMHEEAELGVCAHWSYKEGGNKTLKPYDDKLAWLRQVLEWQEELGGVNLSDLVRDSQNESEDEHVYVFTPEGHVVDLPKGATPLDFAYHVHTEVGHHCRGAKVNGRVVGLNHLLETGEQVEILTAKQSSPNQEWLNPTVGYLRTTRARAKVQQWFRQQTLEYKITEGRKLIERELKRLAIQAIDWQPILHFLNVKTIEEVYEALGSGTVYTTDVLTVQWTAGTEEKVYAVSVVIKSYDRSGLLRDVTQILAHDEVNVTAVNTETSKTDRTAILRLELEVINWAQLGICLEKISRLPYIMEVQRLAPPSKGAAL